MFGIVSYRYYYVEGTDYWHTTLAHCVRICRAWAQGTDPHSTSAGVQLCIPVCSHSTMYVACVLVSICVSTKYVRSCFRVSCFGRMVYLLHCTHLGLRMTYTKYTHMALSMRSAELFQYCHALRRWYRGNAPLKYEGKWPLHPAGFRVRNS